MGRQGSRRWSRKQQKQQKLKGPKTAQATTAAPATTTTKSASMALSAVKQAIALVSGVARHCWGGWGIAKSSTTQVVEANTHPPTSFSTPAPPVVRNDEEGSTVAAAAAAAAAAPATTATDMAATCVTATATLVPDSTAYTTSVPLQASPAPVALCDTYDWKYWTADTKKQLQLLLLLGKRETLLMGLQIGVRMANTPSMDIQDMAELGGLHFAFSSWAYMSRMSVSLALLLGASLMCALFSTMAG